MTALRPIVLLPPSEGKAEGGDEPWDASAGAFGSLGSRRRKVARRLSDTMRSTDQDHLSKLLGVKGATLERAVRANKRLIRRPPALPAAERFTGVVHDHLDLTSLSAAAFERAETDLVFFSALCGIVGPSDPVPDHRAKMSISLDDLGRLSKWWRPAIDETLSPALSDRIVVDLLPAEHRAALTPDPSSWAGWVQARFERVLDDGGRKVVGHEAKAGKGLFARHLLAAESAADDVLTGFCSDGWTVEGIEEPDDQASGPRTVVIVRPAP